ncbi:MAG: M1 family metallopeptidase [Planctomycetota bacterium]
MSPLRPTTLFLSPLVFSAGIAAQIERPIPYPIPQSKAWKAALEAGTRTMDGVPGPEYWTDYSDYEIEAELHPETAIVEGHIVMGYHNRSPKAIRRLYVHLRQNLHKAGSARNRRVEITGGVEVDKVSVDGEELEKRRFSVRGTIMTIRLPEPVPAGGKVSVSMDWKYRVPKKGAPRNGHEDFHVYYLGYWYPQFAVHEDVRGWVAEQYMSTGEFYMGYADYDVEFTVPRGWLVRATGTLENVAEVLTRTARKRLEKARESREIVQVITAKELEARQVTRKSSRKKLSWHFKASNVRDFAVSASDRYVWDATHAEIKDRDGPGKNGIAMIHAVYETEARAYEKAAEIARFTIEHMSETVHPYPWPHMTVCEGVIGGGMEYPMMTICGSRRRGSVLGVVAHELIHMWFPMLVGSNEKAHAWQDEGTTSFMSGLTTAAYRKDQQRAQRTQEEASTRRPRRRRRSGYVRIAARGEQAPLMRHGDRYPGGGSYGLASYAKMSAVMRQLRGLLGDEPFFTALRKYASDWAYKHPYPQDFFNAFSKVSGRDLSWYFRIWFYETWTLDQAVESVRSTEGGSLVTISDLGYATHPTEIEVTYGDNRKETLHLDVGHWLSGKRSKTLEVGSDVKKVVIDPRELTLDISRKNNVWTAETDDR